MILHRLYELAVRENMLDDLAFEQAPVPFVVSIDRDGKYLGISDRRAPIEQPGKKKNQAAKTKLDKGAVLLTPRAHGNVANQGFARFFVDTLPRVLPVTDDEKSLKSRTTFWDQIDRAAEETQDPALAAIRTFGQQMLANESLAQEIRRDIERLEPGPSDRCTFAWNPDENKTIVERPGVRSWYGNYFQSLSEAKQEEGPRGVCQITGEIGPIPRSHSIRLNGIPNGLPTGVSVVCFDKAAFESYDLDGAVNAGIGYRAADGYLRALVALIANKTINSPRTSLRVGSTLFLFWTREAAQTSFMTLLEDPDPEQIAQLLEAVRVGKDASNSLDANEFYLLALSANSARVIVRDYLEAPLPQVQRNVAQWFQQLKIIDTSRAGEGQSNNRFPIWQLAGATAFDTSQVAPNLEDALFLAAVRGGPLPGSILAACLQRLRAEGSEGFQARRLALIKVSLLRRHIDVTEALDEDDRHPAYIYGRLLSIFEQVQYTALGNVNANVVDKFYGTFSAAPGLVFGRLFENAQNHLRKVRTEKPGAYVSLDKLLTTTAGLLTSSAPPNHLGIQDQGRFALGYYHQRAKRFEEIAERKAGARETQEPAVVNS
jgi:CRISPR-associated protein Csd1